MEILVRLSCHLQLAGLFTDVSQTAVCLRPNPRIDLGPVDDSCPLILCDMTLPDQPIVYASPAFSYMTGYTFDEIRGHNCRFLQAPDGQVHAGTPRRYVEKETIRKMQKALEKRREIQLEVVNFKKNGQSFVNVLTMIPVMVNGREHCVGFQCERE